MAKCYEIIPSNIQMIHLSIGILSSNQSCNEIPWIIKYNCIGTKIWHFSHVMSTAEIGDNCVLGQNVFVGKQVTLGNNVKIQNNVSVYEGVCCEDDVFLGPSMVFTNVINPRSAVNRKEEFQKTIVRKGVTIGANATIVCGIELGAYCFIGAGAVVTKNVKPFALLTGVPAVQTGWVSRAGIVLGNDLVCTETGEKYELVDNTLILKDNNEE